MDTSSITFQRLEERHLKYVKFLFWEVFNKKISVRELRAKYNTNYLGVSYICSIAFDNDKPIAFYGALPQLYTSAGKQFLVAHACDSFTLKEYQGKGMHFNLALLAYELMKQNNIKMVYAFHSENTFYSTKKLGWLSYQHLERFHIHLNAIPLAKIYKKLGLSKLYQKRIASIFKPFESNSEIEFNPSFETYQCYNTAFFDYKNSIYPHYIIELDGCGFYCKVDEILRIGFFTFHSDEDLQKALSTLKKICKKLGINEILFQLSKDSMGSNALKKILPAKQSWLVGYLPFEEIEIESFEFNYADLDTF